MSLTIDLNRDYDFVFIYKRKKPLKDNILTTNEKNHIRMIATLQLAKSGQLEYVINHDFTEKFTYNEKRQEAMYLIKIRRKKGDQNNVQSKSDYKPN